MHYYYLLFSILVSLVVLASCGPTSRSKSIATEVNSKESMKHSRQKREIEMEDLGGFHTSHGHQPRSAHQQLSSFLRLNLFLGYFKSINTLINDFIQFELMTRLLGVNNHKASHFHTESDEDDDDDDDEDHWVEYEVKGQHSDPFMNMFQAALESVEDAQESQQEKAEEKQQSGKTSESRKQGQQNGQGSSGSSQSSSTDPNQNKDKSSSSSKAKSSSSNGKGSKPSDSQSQNSNDNNAGSTKGQTSNVNNGGSTNGQTSHASNRGSTNRQSSNVNNGGSTNGQTSHARNGGSTNRQTSNVNNGGYTNGQTSDVSNGGSANGQTSYANNGGSSNGQTSHANNGGSTNRQTSNVNNGGSTNGQTSGVSNGGSANGKTNNVYNGRSTISSATNQNVIANNGANLPRKSVTAGSAGKTTTENQHTRYQGSQVKSVSTGQSRGKVNFGIQGSSVGVKLVSGATKNINTVPKSSVSVAKTTVMNRWQGPSGVVVSPSNVATNGGATKAVVQRQTALTKTYSNREDGTANQINTVQKSGPSASVAAASSGKGDSALIRAIISNVAKETKVPQSVQQKPNTPVIAASNQRTNRIQSQISQKVVMNTAAGTKTGVSRQRGHLRTKGQIARITGGSASKFSAAMSASPPKVQNRKVSTSAASSVAAVGSFRAGQPSSKSGGQFTARFSRGQGITGTGFPVGKGAMPGPKPRFIPGPTFSRNIGSGKGYLTPRVLTKGAPVNARFISKRNQFKKVTRKTVRNTSSAVVGQPVNLVKGLGPTAVGTQG